MIPKSANQSLHSSLFSIHSPSVNAHPPHPDLSKKLLLSDPSLRDGFFNKSVILLAEHSPEEGAFGLILNQPTGKTVGDLVQDPDFLELWKLPVHLGGPVARDQLTFAAFWEREGQIGFATRISMLEAKAYLTQPNSLVKAFAGYSGWEKDQLEDELEQQTWSVTTPQPCLLNDSHDITLWKKIMQGISPYHRVLANAPDEILTN